MLIVIFVDEQGSYVSGPNGRPFPVQRAPSQQQQQQRGMGSPGAASTRHSPFPADSFPPPASPNSAFNQSQYLRLQRANSAPTATTQLPGMYAININKKELFYRVCFFLTSFHCALKKHH